MFLLLSMSTKNLIGSSMYTAMPVSDRHQFFSLKISFTAPEASNLIPLSLKTFLKVYKARRVWNLSVTTIKCFIFSLVQKARERLFFRFLASSCFLTVGFVGALEKDE